MELGLNKDTYLIWAGSDSNQRPPPCQGGILTRLDHRPYYCLCLLVFSVLNIKFVIRILFSYGYEWFVKMVQPRSGTNN